MGASFPEPPGVGAAVWLRPSLEEAAAHHQTLANDVQCRLNTLASLAAQARGGAGGDTPHAALRRVVRRLHAGLNRKCF